MVWASLNGGRGVSSGPLPPIWIRLDHGKEAPWVFFTQFSTEFIAGGRHLVGPLSYLDRFWTRRRGLGGLFVMI